MVESLKGVLSRRKNTCERLCFIYSQVLLQAALRIDNGNIVIGRKCTLSSLTLVIRSSRRIRTSVMSDLDFIRLEAQASQRIIVEPEYHCQKRVLISNEG